MTARPLAALALACLLATAGCSTLVPGEATGTPTPGATPAPIPTDSPTPRPGVDDVPGLTRLGVDDPFALARAHRAVLANTTYTRRTNETTRFANGTLRSRERTVARVESRPLGDRLVAVTTYGGSVHPAGVPYTGAVRLETYVDTDVHHRVTFPNGTTTRRTFRPTDFERRTLELLFSAFETRVVARDDCADGPCYVVESTALDAPGFLAAAFVRLPDRTVRDGSLTAVVDARGLVREYRVRYTVDTPDGPYTAVRTVVYGSMGTTSVERPEWVRNETTGS